MAHVLFSQHDPLDQQPGKIRLSIFLITGECGGPPALAWALHILHGHRRRGGRISALVIMLLLSDLLELLLSPYLVTVLFQDETCWESNTICWISSSLWSASNSYGLLLVQVVALEGALTLRHPLCSAHAFFSFFSIIILILGFLCFFLCELFGTSAAIVFSLPVLLMITLTSCIVTCRAPPQMDDLPYRTRRPSSTVLALVSFTLILYMTFAIMWTVLRDRWGLWAMWASLMSLRVIIDPLLCVLVYRKDIEVVGRGEELVPSNTKEAL